MFTKPILLALLTACGANSSGVSTEPPSERPDKEPPDDDLRENVYFCCHDVDHKTRSGEGCITISEKQIDSCGSVLICANGATKEDGTVTCFD